MIAPYHLDAANHIYNLLFCDDLSYWREGSASPDSNLSRVLTAGTPGTLLRSIADDATEESRTRALAFNRMRAIGEGILARVLLGTIVEVAMEKGLDTMAVFVDRRVRYINQTERMAIFEKVLPNMNDAIDALLAASKKAVDVLGPWDKPRLPPPPKGSARITFLVSDGLYFGQGPFTEFARDRVAGPIFHQAGLLLKLITEASSIKHES
jgi:hypothetical protein